MLAAIAIAAAVQDTGLHKKYTVLIVAINLEAKQKTDTERTDLTNSKLKDN